ncbi:Toxic anion resistance protein (TelA) [Rhizobium sp. VS19-DR104.2]|uniref:toxic anion resistance protein n=1 Tax=unclassified Rhizobium TaxID=2613769 RepID=UPI001CC3BE1D|nr:MULTISPECIES: Toxic anion resistance protein (TelA) [unclassified Rhizobium]MBZ5762563.1 Toxic anion resistance protein (TelA) [Rhizobium sp. VS19-DR96]MBZ5768561.1 Toxic anion resistance protein (TelA) [Rhizobium sp. VS19-DR129.2]MBZ5776432.1 Toxic anion resistance protein (TelA) [Rhizobium sp. VS19-DRK62.2]MBZ5787288.1 Toxic anion resistance protein (TelA) [Rhizobium sp. VS19-DR121]MBZ5804643.1 Toxic anion resistance protein (TelA) [Rhizobium sp. VS19-DR181]
MAISDDLPTATGTQNQIAFPAGEPLATVKVTLPAERVAEAEVIADRSALDAMEASTLVTFGQEAVLGFGAKLDAILDQITKAQSPVLFELFRTIRDGVKGADLETLEADIREKLKGGFIERLLNAIGLGDPAERLKRVSDEVRGMLQSKAKSLSDLVKPMEAKVEEESAKLVGEVSRMSQLADAYRESIIALGVFVTAGRRIVETAEADLDRLTRDAATGDPLLVQTARDHAQKLDIFRNRLLVLETAYAKAPADLDSIGIARGAALATLAETVSAANAEFNDIKSVLIRLHVLFQMQSIQQMNDMRRQLRSSLQRYGMNVLEDVSVNAARASGENRLEDAELVLGTAQRLRAIADKVVAEGDKNKQRFAEARSKLEKARALVTDRPI